MSSGRVWVRVLTLASVACAMALGAIFLLESREIARISGESATRTALVLFAPLAGISLTNYSLFSRDQGRTDLLLEVLIIGTSYWLFLAIALPLSLSNETSCRVFGFFCDEASLTKPLLAALAPATLLCISGFALFRRVRNISDTDS